MSAGGIVSSIFGGSSSGSSGGGGASDSWNQKPMNGASYAARQVTEMSRTVTWQTILSGLIGTYAYIRSYELQKRMVDLTERGVDQAEEYLTLAKRHYDEISVPTFNRTRDHFDFVRDTWRPFLTPFLQEAFRLKEYTPDYTTQAGRAMSTVQAEFDKARRQRARMRGRFQTGRACFEDALFSIRAAEARVAAADHAMRYTDAKKMEMDKWYWTRWTNGAELIGAAIANAISGINNGSATATTSLNAVGNAVGGVRQAAQQLGGALSGVADIYSNAANGAFRYRGDRLAVNQMQQNIGTQNMTARSTTQGIMQGALSGVAGMLPIIGAMAGHTDAVGVMNRGEAPG